MVDLIAQTRLWLQKHRSEPQQANARREVLRLALPAAGEQMLSMMVSIVDTILVGHLSASSLAAMSLSTQWVFLITTLFTAISTGATALVARSVGAKDWGTANRAVRQSIAIGLTIGLLATLLGVIFAEPAVRLMGADTETLPQGATYMRIVALAFTFQSLMFVGNASLRGAGDTRTTMAVMGIVNLLNIIVAWTGVNGPFGLPKLGVAGAGIGATVGRTVGGLLVIGILIKGRSGLKLDLRGWRIDWPMLKRLLNVGLPTGGERIAMQLGQMTFVRIIAGMGTISVAAHAVALRAESLSFMPGFGFAVAGTTLVGQALGAGDPKRAEQNGYLTCRIAAILMSVMGLVFILLPQPLIRIFTSDPQVIAAAIMPLRIVGFVQPLLAAAQVFPGNLRGAGDTRFPMFVTGASVWAIRVPIALIVGQLLGVGLIGAWLGMAADLIVRGTIFFLRFRSGRWKTAQV
ncbi:MAG: MATE family efflux transporter [Anaerolineae bacterium]|nr:MATE family efflux transporter [Anaerolineae bacterium]